MNSCTKPLSPIVYHYFPHYRAGVNRELIASRKYEYLFVGADKAPPEDGIECWSHPKDVQFLDTKLYFPLGRSLFQSHVLRLALRRNIHSIIFLGCAEFATTWIAAALARLSGKRVYFWTHGWTEPDRGLKKYFRMAFYRLANVLLLYGHHAKKIGLECGIRPERMHVIFNSLDYKVQMEACETVKEGDLPAIRAAFFGGQAARPMLICTGRLIPMRHLDLLLDAMKYLDQEGFPVNLLLIGDGPGRSALKSQAEQNHLSVHFYGPCYDETLLASFFMAADLLAMPGRIGLAAMHSLAYGTPVVVHDNPYDQGPEWEAIIPGFNGAHFAHADSRDLARVLRQWLEKAPDRKLIRTRCREVIEKFYNPATQVELIERALDGEPADDSAWDEFRRRRLVLLAEKIESQLTVKDDL